MLRFCGFWAFAYGFLLCVLFCFRRPRVTIEPRSSVVIQEVRLGGKLNKTLIAPALVLAIALLFPGFARSQDEVNCWFKGYQTSVSQDVKRGTISQRLNLPVDAWTHAPTFGECIRTADIVTRGMVDAVHFKYFDGSKHLVGWAAPYGSTGELNIHNVDVLSKEP